jgi:aminopeptidase N
MWASYHDQWLSEGFADFAAALFLQQAVGPKWQKDYQDYWDRQKRRVLDKNNFGVAPNDAGPLWLGLRLISPRSSNAYQGLTYSKGAFVLSMLRSMMRTDQAASGDRDKAFIEMMHDFIESHRDTPASTESFKAVVEKHMSKEMDLQKNGRLDWFFNEWVYGTQIPRYDLKYETGPASGGIIKIKVQLTQSEVDNNFAMIVPIFGEFGNGMVRLAQVPIVGNSTRNIILDVDKQPKKIVLNAYKDMLER